RRLCGDAVWPAAPPRTADRRAALHPRLHLARPPPLRPRDLRSDFGGLGALPFRAVFLAGRSEAWPAPAPSSGRIRAARMTAAAFRDGKAAIRVLERGRG